MIRHTRCLGRALVSTSFDPPRFGPQLATRHMMTSRPNFFTDSHASMSGELSGVWRVMMVVAGAATKHGTKQKGNGRCFGARASHSRQVKPVSTFALLSCTSYYEARIEFDLDEVVVPGSGVSRQASGVSAACMCVRVRHSAVFRFVLIRAPSTVIEKGYTPRCVYTRTLGTVRN